MRKISIILTALVLSCAAVFAAKTEPSVSKKADTKACAVKKACDAKKACAVKKACDKALTLPVGATLLKEQSDALIAWYTKDGKYYLVYNWVKKYNESGEEGLKDNRGKSKSEKDLTELEKKDREIEKLKLELERVKRAEEILKKNLEIREQLMRNSRKYNK